MKSFVVVIAVLFGCADPSGPELEQFQFFRDQALEPAVRVAGGQVIIEGSIRTPCLPYEVHAKVYAEDRDLRFIVVGQDQDDNCPMDSEGSLGYRGAVSPVGTGRWTVTVVHQWNDAQWPEEIAVEEEVTL